MLFEKKMHHQAYEQDIHAHKVVGLFAKKKTRLFEGLIH